MFHLVQVCDRAAGRRRDPIDIALGVRILLERERSRTLRGSSSMTSVPGTASKKSTASASAAPSRSSEQRQVIDSPMDTEVFGITRATGTVEPRASRIGLIEVPETTEITRCRPPSSAGWICLSNGCSC